MFLRDLETMKSPNDERQSSRHTNGDGEGDIPGRTSCVLPCALFVCSAGVDTRKTEPLRDPLAVRATRQRKAAERARNERRKGSRLGPPGEETDGPTPIYPPRPPRPFAAVLSPACGIRGRRALTWGGYDNGLVFYFLIQTSCLWALWIPARGIILHAINTCVTLFLHLYLVSLGLSKT